METAMNSVNKFAKTIADLGHSEYPGEAFYRILSQAHIVITVQESGEVYLVTHGCNARPWKTDMTSQCPLISLTDLWEYTQDQFYHYHGIFKNSDLSNTMILSKMNMKGTSTIEKLLGDSEKEDILPQLQTILQEHLISDLTGYPWTTPYDKK